MLRARFFHRSIRNPQARKRRDMKKHWERKQASHREEMQKH